MSDADRRNLAKSRGTLPRSGWAALVPELLVTNITKSLAFYVDYLGFDIAYERPAARFAYLESGGAQLMLCERNGRWELGEIRYPLGQGVSLQISLPSIEPIEAALIRAGCSPYESAADVWYQVGSERIGQRELLVQDPDGYLLRFVAEISVSI